MPTAPRNVSSPPPPGDNRTRKEDVSKPCPHIAALVPNSLLTAMVRPSHQAREWGVPESHPAFPVPFASGTSRSVDCPQSPSWSFWTGRGL